MDSDNDKAKSVMRMHGGRAEMVAIEHVNNSRREGDAQSYERWLRIAGQIRVISGQIKS